MSTFGSGLFGAGTFGGVTGSQPLSTTDSTPLLSAESASLKVGPSSFDIGQILASESGSTAVPKSATDLAAILSADIAAIVQSFLLAASETSPLLSADGASQTSGAPPVLTSIVASRISDTSILVTWNTNVPSSSQVEYGTTQVYGTLTPYDARPVTAHSVTLNNLLPSTAYHFRVRSDG